MTNLPFILRLIPCVGLWLVLFAPIKTKALDTNAAAGFELAKKYCARCHVIGEFNRLGGIGNTPSFPYMVKMLTGRNGFLRFLPQTVSSVCKGTRNGPRVTLTTRLLS